ncbi:MFS transporter [Microlunatus sp. GCM10028923]|uniref:MFS transporter n=1 Tax=Microlunatus sp. GCM10028923 TaxID=3273400 RepID=UPI00360B351D
MIMTVGSIMATGAVLMIAWSPHPVIFAAGWLLAGLAMSGVLYQPAFAALTRWYGPRRLTALTAVTLVAGLASTVFAPLTNALGTRLDWRTVYVVLGALLAVTTIPLHAVALRRPWPAEPHPTLPTAGADDGDYATKIIRSRSFVSLAIGLTAASLAMYAVVINLIPLLTERGLTPSLAAWALGLGGVGQVTGRLLYAPLAARLNLRTRTMIVFGFAAAATAAFAIVPGPAGLLIAISIAAGLARGIATLLQATAVPDRWGSRSYGRISGLLAAPITITSALAPWIGAGIAAFTGYQTMFLCLAVIGAAAAIVLTASTVPTARLPKIID